MSQAKNFNVGAIFIQDTMFKKNIKEREFIEITDIIDNNIYFDIWSYNNYSKKIESGSGVGTLYEFKNGFMDEDLKKSNLLELLVWKAKILLTI